MQPSVDRGEDERLPGLEAKKRASKALALDVRMELDEAADALGRGVIEEERKVRVTAFDASEIIKLALAGETRPLAGEDLSGENGTAITKGSGDMR